MASGIWPAVSGAAAQAEAVDVIANNLANVNTDGFKKDLPTFKEYLAVVEREQGPKDIQPGPIKDKEFYPLDGRDKAYVLLEGTYTDFGTGNIRVTHNPLDLALMGPGFFEVSTPDGIRYTRHGSFKVAMDGRLVTTTGHPVLMSQAGGLAPAQLAPTAVQPSQGGLATTQGGVGAEPEVIARFIQLDPNNRAPISLTPRGELYQGGQLVAQLRIAEFNDNNMLWKTGSNLFANRNPTNISTEPPKTMVKQGVLETSNVNPAEELTRLIRTQRLFEHDLKAVKTYDEMMAKEANEIGKL